MADPHVLDNDPHPTHGVAAQASPCDELIIRAQPTALDSPCRRKRLALAATILGSSMAFIDGSVVNVALPAIQSELHASVAALQWVVNAYLLFLASLVLVGGSMGDKLGRRTVFIVGIGIFTLASAACGLAPNAGSLIAARAVQGIGAALFVPSSLASSSCRLGMLASTPTSFEVITWLGSAPAVITNFSCALANSCKTLATATGSAEMP